MLDLEDLVLSKALMLDLEDLALPEGFELKCLVPPGRPDDAKELVLLGKQQTWTVQPYQIANAPERYGYLATGYPPSEMSAWLGMPWGPPQGPRWWPISPSLLCLTAWAIDCLNGIEFNMDNDREAPMGPFGWQSHLEVTRRLCKVAKIPGINHDVLGKPMPSVRKDGLNELRFLCGQIVDDFHSGKTEAAIATAVANEVPKIEAGTPPAVPPKPASKGKNIDARMLKVMADNLESHGWPARKWATHLNCNHSTICGTATWRGPLKTMQEIYKLNSIANRNKSPKSPRKTRQRSHG